jgi:hypothetical protein
MITAVFKTQSGQHPVTKEQILRAMNEFDLRYRATEQDAGTIYSVEEGGKRYPPKRILEIATGVPTNHFYGGKPSNDVFRTLGFHVSTVDSQIGWKSPEQIAAEQARLQYPFPKWTIFWQACSPQNGCDSMAITPRWLTVSIRVFMSWHTRMKIWSVSALASRTFITSV